LAADWPRGYINGVDLTEKRRLDAARQQVNQVRTRARPWRSIAALAAVASAGGRPRTAAPLQAPGRPPDVTAG